MPNDCTALRMTVMYRVHCVIFLRPSSPSFCSLASGSYTTVSNCRMIDAVMYGMMPRAKIVMRRSWPPENRSTNPSSDPLVLLCVKKLFQLGCINPRRGKVPAQPVHEQHRQCEQDALAQVRNAEDVRQFLEHYSTSAAFTARPQPCRPPW